MTIKETLQKIRTTKLQDISAVDIGKKVDDIIHSLTLAATQGFSNMTITFSNLNPVELTLIERALQIIDEDRLIKSTTKEGTTNMFNQPLINISVKFAW